MSWTKNESPGTSERSSKTSQSVLSLRAWSEPSIVSGYDSGKGLLRIMSSSSISLTFGQAWLFKYSLDSIGTGVYCNCLGLPPIPFPAGIPLPALAPAPAAALAS